uniref:PIG-L family deacetylase n=2 Tax=Thermorudis TaxID=1649508 RepID=A0A831TER8_9BACT
MLQEPETQRAMVIVAHPDDAEFGCAGTVARWADEGWHVTYVILTDGSGGGPDDAMDVGPAARQAISRQRKAEQRAAADVLGVKEVLFLDYPDGSLQPTLELRRDIVRVVRQYRPARVIIPSPDRVWVPSYVLRRQHPDHLAAGQAALAALYPAAQNPWDFPELLAEGLAPHRVSEIYVIGAPTLNYAVDITSTLDRKIKALRAHRSQLGDRFGEIERMIRTAAAERGVKHGMEYAEEFHRIVHW